MVIGDPRHTSAQISQKQDGYKVYVIKCPTGYHHNGFVANSHIYTHNVRLHIAGTNEQKSAQQAKKGA